MPELPETETIARDLRAAIVGQSVAGISVVHADVLRGVTARSLRSRVAGTTIEGVWRRAKLVVLDLSSGDRLVVQPRFTGALLLDDGCLAATARRYAAITFSLSDGRKLHYSDVRRLGTVALMAPPRFAAYSAAIGPEPLDPAFTARNLWGVLRGSRRAVKKVLMDQRHVAGVGNIYANESLWRAGIDPSRPGRRVTPQGATAIRTALVDVLSEAIAARGTTFRDYRDANGERGGFAAHLDAYGRAGLPCRRCGARLVGTHAVDGRATVFCARCQR